MGETRRAEARHLDLTQVEVMLAYPLRANLQRDVEARATTAGRHGGTRRRDHRRGTAHATRRRHRGHRLRAPPRHSARAGLDRDPAGPSAAASRLDASWRKNSVSVALNLIPFAGLAFLWFVGAVRDRIGAAEDGFFATVFLGTALLFVAMLFAAGALAGGLVAATTQRSAAQISPEVWRFGRHTTFLLVTIYAMRMAGAFIIVTTTIGRRLGILPRWLTVLGAIAGVVLLLTVDLIAWIAILFPAWVLLLSIYILVQPRPNRTEI